MLIGEDVAKLLIIEEASPRVEQINPTNKKRPANLMYSVTIDRS
jgi:hypothetical protein